jgi:hypothetical protein
MIWKNLDVNLDLKHLVKTFFNKKKNELLTIYSDGTFYTWLLSMGIVLKKNLFFFFNKKLRISLAVKLGIGKIACLGLYGNIIIIDIFSMKKLLIIKTTKKIWEMCYLPKYIIGLTVKGNLCIFYGKKFQNFTLILLKKNQINYISNKNCNTIVCAHKNQDLSEYNVLEFKFEKKILSNIFFKSKISIIKHFQGMTVIISTKQEIFLFDNLYLLLKKVKNNLFKFGKIIFILKFYKDFFYYSTKNGFLCIFNFKKITKTLFMTKKISNNLIIGLYLLKKKTFFELDICNNYSFFINKQIFSSRQIPKSKIKWINLENFSFNKKFLALLVENFLLLWSNCFIVYRRHPSLVVKLNNIIDKNDFCCLAEKKNIIATSLKSNKKIRFFRLTQFKNIYLCTELIINIQTKIKNFYASKFIFSSDGDFLCGIFENKKKLFIVNFKNNSIVLFFIKISSTYYLHKNEEFLNLVLINNKIVSLTKMNSILIFTCKEGFLCFKKNFWCSQKIKSISTGFIGNRILILLYFSGLIQLYKLKKKKLFELKQLFFSHLKIKQIKCFGYNNQNALFIIRNGFLIIPFFFNINKKNFKIFPVYFLRTLKLIFPIIFQNKKSINKLILLKCQ